MGLGRLTRGLESHIVHRVDSLRIDKANINSVVLTTVRVGVQLGNLSGRGSGRGSGMDGGDLLVLEGLGLGGAGGQ